MKVKVSGHLQALAMLPLHPRHSSEKNNPAPVINQTRGWMGPKCGTEYNIPAPDINQTRGWWDLHVVLNGTLLPLISIR